MNRLKACAQVFSSPWASLCVCAILSAAGLLVAPPFTAPLGSIDPWVYTGLAFDYHQLVERFGATYYASRILHISLLWFFDFLFGQPAGVVFLKFVLLTSVSWVVCRWSLCLFRSLGISFCLSLLSSFSPFLTGHYLGDHYDLTATAFLLFAYLCSLWKSTEVRLFAFFAGMTLAAAFNTNQFTLGVYLTAIPGILIFQSCQARGQIKCFLIFLILGFLVGNVLLQAILWISSDIWRKDGLSLFRTILSLLKGGMADWYVSFFDACKVKYYYVLSPLFLGLALLAAGNKKERDSSKSFSQKTPKTGFALIGVSSSLFFIGFAEIFKAGILLCDYYLIYLFPSIIVTIGGLLYYGSDSGKNCVPNMNVIITCFLGLFIWFSGYKITNPAFGKVNLVTACFFGLISILTLKMRPFRKIEPYILGIFIAFFFYLPFSIKRGPRDPSEEWRARQEIKSLQAATRRVSPDFKRSIGFWYDEKSYYLNSLQSSLLWGFSKLAESYREINTKLIQSMQRYPGGVILLDKTKDGAIQKIEEVKAFINFEEPKKEKYYLQQYTSGFLDDKSPKTFFIHFKILPEEEKGRTKSN